jgi:hypothetical protein
VITDINMKTYVDIPDENGGVGSGEGRKMREMGRANY